MNKGTLFPRFLVVLGLLLLVTSWGVANATESTPSAQVRWRAPVTPAQPSLETTPPLLYALPDTVPADHASVLKVEALADGKVMFRQEIKLPAGLSEGSVVELLAEPVNERKPLEKLEAASSGSIRLDLSIGGLLLEEISLPELEAETARLSPLAKPAVGTPQRLDVLVGDRPAHLATKAIEDGRDPECVQRCDDDRYDCYWNRCDRRGSCDYCEEYYHDCVLGCPLCPTTQDTSTTTVLSQSFYYEFACFFDFIAGTGTTHELSYRTLRTRIWRTVTQCDGSSTTTLQSDYVHSETCWQELPPPDNYCSPWTFNHNLFPICLPY